MKTKLLIFLFFIWVSLSGQVVPNTSTFSLQNVVKVTGGTSLQEAFDLSIDSLFDIAYKGDKTSLYNFRNYGSFTIYGWLYNWYVGVSALNIANTGWHMPTRANWTTLATTLGGLGVAGGKLKETGTFHWLTPNTGATNSSGFTGMPGGYRYVNGTNYYDMTKWGRWWTADSYTSTAAYGFGIDYNSDDLEDQNFLKKHGFSIVLIKDAACAVNGATGTYTGNDGHVYSTICIGTQEWLSENLTETKYRDLSLIPAVYGDAAWAALVTPGRSIYGNH